MKNISVSVIIPMYNASKFIKKCIKSVLSQTYGNFELIIVNDGSTDNSLEICSRFKDDRIRIVNQKNQGSIYSRLNGIKEAKGDYICFIDADDWVANDYLETLMEAVYKYNVDLVCIKDYRTIDGLGLIKIKDFKDRFKEKLYQYEDLVKYNHVYTLNRVFSNTVWGKLYKKDLFADYGNQILNIFYGDDVMMNLSVTENINSCYMIDKYKYYYRYGGYTLSKSNYNRFWDDNVKLYYEEKKIALKYNDKDMAYTFARNILNIFNWCIVYKLKYLRAQESEIFQYIDNVIHSKIYDEFLSVSGYNKDFMKSVRERNAAEILKVVKSQNKSNIPYYKYKLLGLIFKILNW